MAKKSVNMPMSGAGLMNFSKDFKSKFEISPRLLFFLIVIFSLAVLVINYLY